jgi:phosphate transport system permease protein
MRSATGHLRRRHRIDSIFRNLCFAAASAGTVLLVIFLVKIMVDGLGRLSFDFIRNMQSSNPQRTGIWPAIMGSLYLMVLTAVIAVPVGVAAAVYLEEFQRRKNWLANFIQLNIANLAGVPSIVYGLLGLAVFFRWLAFGPSLLTGALTMALLILPMVIIVTQEALKAVPNSYREAALALGCTPWQMIRFQVLPNAASGIFTGIILALSRAIGETAPLIVVGAVTFTTALPRTVQDQYTVLPITIFNWAGEARTDFHVAAAGAIIVLIVSLLVLNSVAIYLRARARGQQRA